MNHRRTAFVVLCWVPLAACAAPRAVKNAVQLQSQALRETQSGVQGYRDLTGRILDKTIEARNFGKEAEIVAAAVQRALESQEEDPLEASDQVALALFTSRSQPSAEAEQFRKEHDADLLHLILLLQLLERSQALIQEYVETDVGPTREQISSLRAEFDNLQRIRAGGNP